MSGSRRRVIPREELSEFQRWQFSSLLEPHSAAPEPVLTPEPVLEHIEPEVQEAVVQELEAEILAEEQLPYPTADEIEAIERQAHEEGYQAGLQLGRDEAAAEVAALRGLLDGLNEAVQQSEMALANSVLDLSLVVARQLLRQEISADRSLVLSVIREALAGLPAAKAPARILLNPDDLIAVTPLLANELPADVWRLVAEPALASGECRIETSASSVDLTLATRWQGVLKVLGRNKRADLEWAQGDAAFESVEESAEDDDLAT